MPGIIKSAQAVVHITAGEIVPASMPSVVVGPGGTEVEQDFDYNLGDADVWVSDISPHFGRFVGESGVVEFIVHVDFGSPIDVGITITVEDQTPIEVDN
jgi:hypothetical protein